MLHRNKLERFSLESFLFGLKLARKSIYYKLKYLMTPDSVGRLLVISPRIQLPKRLLGTNTLAYYEEASATNKNVINNIDIYYRNEAPYGP
jgi:hypothetical protein